MLPPGWVARVRVPGLRWWIAGLVFIATIVNFIDRLTIAILAPVIMAQLGLTNLRVRSHNHVVSNCLYCHPRVVWESP